MSDHEHFHEAYARDVPPPWDIGRPQPALVEAGRRGWVRGRVLDVGCGTGENALFFAAEGCEVVGVDVVPAAIQRAAAKATERGLAERAQFIVADVLTQPQALGDRAFETVIDMGFFHTLGDDDRLVWRRLLADLLRPGGSYVMVCFSDLVPGSQGPRRVSEAEIRDAYPESAGFRVADLERTALESNREGAAVDVAAWLARIERGQGRG